MIVNTATPSIVEIPGGLPENGQVLIGMVVPGGTVQVETRPLGGGAWSPLAKASPASLASGFATLRVEGPVGALRLTFASPGSAQATVWAVPMDAPKGLYTGSAAITTQPYTEANVKNGLQFYLRAAWPLADVIVAGASRKIRVSTGVKPVIVKLREVAYVAEQLTLNLFSAPVGVSGGTPLTIHNYNRVNGVASTVTATKNVTTTSDGTPFDAGDPEYFFGSANAPQRQSSAIAFGRERILPANTTFLVVLTNSGTGDARASYFLDWFEGAPDLPL